MGRKNMQIKQTMVAIAAVMCSMASHAEYHSPDGNFSLSGFGTLSYARSTTDEAYYNYRGQGSGVDRSGGLGTDSKAALQGTYKLTPTVSGTAQVMSKLRPEGDFQPDVEWAFAKWLATPNLSVRAGRMGVPFFMLSDFRDVNYAITASRPSMDVYGQVPVSNFEGGDISYKWSLGSAVVTGSVWTGTSETKYALDFPANRAPSDIKIANQKGLNITAELDNGLSLRLGHMTGKLSLSSDGTRSIVSGAKTFAAAAANPTVAQQYNDVANELTAEDKDARFSGIGFNYDQGNWVASGEYTIRKTKSYVSDSKGMYALLGYRMGNLTPYVSLSKITTTRRSDTYAPAPSCSNLAIGCSTTPTDPTFARYVGMANVYYGTRFILDTQKVDEKTSSLGVRWDAKSNIAVKAQLDHISKPEDSSGLFLVPLTNLTTGNPATDNAWIKKSKSVNVLTISMDYVF